MWVPLRVCGSCQGCQHDWRCSGPEPSVEQPFTPHNTHAVHTHKTSVLHTQTLCYHDATRYVSINSRRAVFTAALHSRSVAKIYLLLLLISHQCHHSNIRSIPPNNNISQRHASGGVICTVQTQCHSSSDISNSDVMAVYCASLWVDLKERRPALDGLFLSRTSPPHTMSNREICNGVALHR